MLLLVFSTSVFVIVLGVIAVSTHFYVVCFHVICLMLLFHGHVSYRSFPITGPLLCLQDWKILLSSSSETQGQIVGERESLNGQKNMARTKVKNGEKSHWGQCLTRPVPNGRRHSDF